jgi:DNA-directed RNA polymerase specialized sigma24 family protein
MRTATKYLLPSRVYTGMDTGKQSNASDSSADYGALADLMADADADPERLVARMRFIVALEDALRALPDDQRAVFIAYEIDGVSFKAMAQASGASVNTLLSRKHASVEALRLRLQTVHDEMLRD